MATWVTHLRIADIVLENCPTLHRRGFCVGSIAPDCNIENETWTEFTPPREVTHWMTGNRKNTADCDRFLTEYLLPQIDRCQPEKYSFLLGYWAHLIEDAEFQRYIRDEDRVRASWKRVLADPEASQRAEGLPETYDSIKQILPKKDRMREIDNIDARYLAGHPDSGFFTEILPLKEFPDYIDYLPSGSIVRKIGVMGILPVAGENPLRFLAISEEEYDFYIAHAAGLVQDALLRNHLIP